MSVTPNLVEFKAGDVILLEGEISDALYILESGTIEVIKESKVLCELSDRKTFFGEMAFILRRRRTATLRAKTPVRALKISNLDPSAMDSRMAKASIAFLKVMASRLDLSNEENRRLEGYADFYEAMRQEAQTDPKLKEAFMKVEKKVRISQKKESDRLLSDYLKTPWVWTKIEESVMEMLKCYLKDDIQVDELKEWISDSPMFGICSSINFSGDRNGTVVIDMEDGLVRAIQMGMGLGDGEAEAETTQEMSNLILGNLKKKMQQQSIVLDTPKQISDTEQLKNVLHNNPALTMSIGSSAGSMRLVYQLELQSNVR